MSVKPGSSVVMLTADRGIDRRILLEADSLRAAGWQVTIVGAPVQPGEVCDPPGVVRAGSGPAAGTSEGRVMSTYAWVRTRLAMNAPLMRLMKWIAWRFFIDLETFYTRLYAPSLSGLEASVVVAHDLPMLPLGAETSARWGARLVYDSHELFVEQGFPRWLVKRWQRIESQHIARADTVITVNESIARELALRYGIDRVHVIRNAEQPPSGNVHGGTPLRDALGLPADARIVLYQGGLIAGRNLAALVDAMKHVGDPDVHLVFLGDGRLRDALRRRTRDRRVHFLDAVPQRRLLAYTADADAGVVPSRADCLNNYYSSPNKLFEFIAVGVPVLGTDLPEIARLVRGHDIGVLVPDPDAVGLAAAIEELFADRSRYSRWRANARRAAKRVNWTCEAKRLVEIYEALR